MLLKPVVPLSPVKMKLKVVVLADEFVVIVRLAIWELVMLPLMARLTPEPFSVVVGAGVFFGVGKVDAVVVDEGKEVGLDNWAGEAVGLGAVVASGESDITETVPSTKFATKTSPLPES